MDRLQSLHDLGAELREEKLTVKEVKAALKVHSLLQGYGVNEESYSEVILACTKMHSDGFAAAAQELANMENTTGLNYQALMQQCHTANDNIVKTEKKLSALETDLKNTKHALADMKKERNLAAEKLKSMMDNLGFNMRRLESVEKLALALKKAGVNDNEVRNYVSRQQEIDKSGIGLDILTEILKEVNVSTIPDQGKGLLKMLSEYGSLAEAIKELNARMHELEKQTGVLEERKKLKEELEDYLAKLRTKKASLEKSLAHLSDEKETLTQLQKDVKSLNDKRTMLEHDIIVMKKHKEDLSEETEALQKKISNLKGLEVKHDSLSAGISEIEAKINSSRTELDVLHSFLGFIEPSSFHQVDEFVSQLPTLLADARQRIYSPELLRDFILKELDGGKLHILKCSSCNARLFVDKLPRYSMVSLCPVCIGGLLRVAQDEAKILKAAINQGRPKHLGYQGVPTVSPQ